MPLTDATNEIVDREDRELINSSAQWSTWPEALDRLWACRRKITIWIAVGLIVSVPLCLRLPKYKSAAQLMPPDTSNSSALAALALPTLAKSPGLSGLAGMASDLFGVKSTGALFIKVLQSRRVTDSVINRFDLRKHWGSAYLEPTREKLLDRTLIEEDKKSGVITISFRDRDAQLAQQVVGAYIEELDRTIKEVSTSAARRERTFLEQRLASEKKALDEAQQKFSQFASSNMALDIPEQTKVTVEAASRLEGELIANRAQLEVLQQTYTPENYRVKNLQTHVNELERELTRLNTGKSAKGASDASNPYPAVKNLPVLGVQWSDLYRDAKIHETVFELLTQQYEMAGIQEAREIPVIKVLDPPSSPEFKRPSVWLILLISSVVSALLAALGILVRDQWAMWNTEDPRRVLLAKVYSGTRESINFWRSKRNQQDERSYKS